MGSEITTLTILQVANLLLSGYLMSVIFNMGIKTKKGLFSKSLRMIFAAVALLFVSEVILMTQSFSGEALETVFSIATFFFLILLIFAICEIRKDLLANTHLMQRRGGHNHQIRDVE